MYTKFIMGAKQSRTSLDRNLEFLQIQTGQDENTIKEQYQRFKNEFPTGKLKRKDFLKICKELFPTENGDEFCQHVFRAFDTDSNGFIDSKEFLLAINLTSNGNAEEKLKCAFSMFDVDGNGVIDQQEITTVLHAMYKAYNRCDDTIAYSRNTLKEGMKDVFKFLDENNDGQLTEEEFISQCLQDNNMSKLFSPQFLQ